MSFNIIIRKYEGYNSAMGKYIHSKREYMNEMEKGEYISYEKACQIAESVKNKKKSLELSAKAQEVIKTAYNSKDSKGKVSLGDRTIDAMKEIGVNFYQTNIPKHYMTDKGGFDNAC